MSQAPRDLSTVQEAECESALGTGAPFSDVDQRTSIRTSACAQSPAANACVCRLTSTYTSCYHLSAPESQLSNHSPEKNVLPITRGRLTPSSNVSHRGCRSCILAGLASYGEVETQTLAYIRFFEPYCLGGTRASDRSRAPSKLGNRDPERPRMARPFFNGHKKHGVRSQRFCSESSDGSYLDRPRL